MAVHAVPKLNPSQGSLYMDILQEPDFIWEEINRIGWDLMLMWFLKIPCRSREQDGSVIMLSVSMLSVIMLSVIMLSVNMLSAIILSFMIMDTGGFL